MEMSGQLHAPAVLSPKGNRIRYSYDMRLRRLQSLSLPQTHTTQAMMAHVCMSGKLLLVLASKVILGSQFHGIHCHILLSWQLWQTFPSCTETVVEPHKMPGLEGAFRLGFRLLLFGLLFNSDDGGDKFFRNYNWFSWDYTALYHKWHHRRENTKSCILYT
jgi:hypothetical protein